LKLVTCGGNQDIVAHVKGVAAILSSEEFPFDLFAATQLFQLGNSFLLEGPLKVCPFGVCDSWVSVLTGCQEAQHLGVHCAPSSNGLVKTLDRILIKFNPIFLLSNKFFTSSPIRGEDVIDLLYEAKSLEQEFCAWTDNFTEDRKPKTLGSFNESQLRTSKSAAWAGPVDVYFDRKIYA
jgi:hypothetical protein